MGKRPGFLETIRITRRVLRARDVLMKVYDFTTSRLHHYQHAIGL